MSQKAAKLNLAPQLAVEIPDEITAVEPYTEGGFGDTCEIVVPIRADLQNIILAQLEDDLRWNRSIINSPCANDAPSWTGRVKRASLAVKSIEQKIVKIKEEMKKK
ncbi:hypothetical protein KKA33_02725 [Patescibacteria group bacterium]|nr:hypothetical protein [Patescibacteria group bacterium]